MRIVATFIVLFAVSAFAEEDSLEYLYLPDLGERQNLLLDRIVIHARNTEHEYALSLSQDLLDNLEPLRETNPTVYGQVMINHGIIQVANHNRVLGLSIIDRGLEFLEQRTNPFSETLINGVMAKALTHLSLDEFEEAEDGLRRAQHITHRTGGVYAEDQLTMVNYLTATMLRRGMPIDADREQLFALRVAEQVYGPESEEILPTLNRLGSYFATRGSTIPVFSTADVRIERDLLFRNSINMYERAIDIIEQHYGHNDLRLVQPLRGMASARMLQITSRKYAEAALERSLEIVQANPSSDLGDRAQALVDLGDLYIITNDKRANLIYLQAWDLLQESEQSQVMAYQLFNTPKRLFPRGEQVMYLDRMPDKASPGDPLFAELEYAVNTDGKVNSVKVVDRNVPNEQIRMLRYNTRKARFRPRIIDGEVVPTTGLTLYQQFELLYPRYAEDDDIAVPDEDETESDPPA